MIVRVLVVLLFSNILLGSSDSDPIFIGSVRNDGILIPFAAYHGGEWKTPWPTPQYGGGETDEKMPLKFSYITENWTLGMADFFDSWTLLPQENTSRPLKLIEPMMVPASCGTTIGFQTDAPLGEVSPRSWPVETMGLAATEEGILSKVVKEYVRLESKKSEFPEPEGHLRQIVLALRDDIERLEEPEIRAVNEGRHLTYEVDFGYIRRPIAPSEEDLSTVYWLYRSQKPFFGGPIYYLEFTKTYSQSRFYSVFKFWLLEKNGGIYEILDESISTMSESGADKGHVAERPMGFCVVDGGLYVLARRFYYEGYPYVIFRIGESTVEEIIQIDGGGC